MTTSPPKKSISPSTSSAGRPPQSVKFARRTSSGRIVSLSRDDDLDLSGDFSGQNDYINYTVMMPPTPDNQPGVENSSDSKPDPPGPYGTTRFRSESRRRDGSGGGGPKMDRRLSLIDSSNSKSMLMRTQTQDFDHNRWLFETKGTYGIGNAYWQEDNEDPYGHDTGVSMSDFMDKPWKPLSRKVKVPAAVISPYR